MLQTTDLPTIFKNQVDGTELTIFDLPFANSYIDAVLTWNRRPEQAAAKAAGITIAQARQILVKPAVQVYLKEKVDEYLAAADVRKIQVIEELLNLSFSNMSDIADFDGTEVTFKNWKNLTPDVLSSIAEVKIGKNGEISMKQHNKLTALFKLAELIKLSKDTEPSGTVNNIYNDNRLFGNATMGKPA